MSSGEKFLQMFICIIVFFGVVAVVLLLTSRLRSRRGEQIQFVAFVLPAVAADLARSALPRDQHDLRVVQGQHRGRVRRSRQLPHGLHRLRAAQGAAKHCGVGRARARSLSTSIGLVYAVLVDRSRFEKFAKALIFLPMAISLVGASIIWKFVYDYKDTSNEQIGLANETLKVLGLRHLPVPAQRAVEHPLPHRHHDLGPGRLRDDSPLGVHQGHPRGHRRGGPPRRRGWPARCSASSPSRASGRP